jgi:histidinol-phosphate aminotransferase
VTTDIRSLLAPGIQDIAPYQPGKPLSELEREYGITDAVKLASNENPLGAGSRALAAARTALEEIGRYPDGGGFALRRALARRLDVAPEQITLGNGSNDVLELMARTFAADGGEIVFAQHAFVVYELATRAIGARPVVVPARNWGHDLAAMRQAVTARTRLVFIANPNNPTGTWVDRAALDAFLQTLPERVLVVLDEAYFEYVEESDYPNGIALRARYPNLVVTRTFSKIHGLAGLRIGYAVSTVEMAEYLNRVRQPFNVNNVALAAAEAALDDKEHVQRSRAVNREGMQQLTEGLRRLGCSFIPSVANFVTFDVGRPTGPVYEQLLRRGVIVRPIGGYGMPQHLRVTVGLPEENARFLAALGEILDANAAQ